MKTATTSRRPSLLPRSFQKRYPVAVRGEGPWLWDASGQRYFDLAGSAAVNLVGHGDKSIASAIAQQAESMEFVHSSQFTSGIAERFAEQVLSFAGPAFEGGGVFFTSGGSEAIETALKLARQYQVEIGQTKRSKFLSREQAYHGATLGAMAVSGNRKRREIYLPLFHDSAKVNTPYCYRCKYGCDNCAIRYAEEVEKSLSANGSGTAAFLFEPVSGATLGAAVPPAGYLERVAKACRGNGVLVIADEVMTGFGRTGCKFAVDHWGVRPDMLVVAKGIASGYAPLGAVIANRKIVEAIRSGSGALVHGFTYNAHPISMSAGYAVLQKMLSEKLVEAASSEGDAGRALSTALFTLKECNSVGDIRGLGLLWGVEFVSNRSTKTPFVPGVQYSNKIAAEAAIRGVMTYPMQGCVDGIAGDHLLIAPPAISKPDELRWAIDQLRLAILDVERKQPQD